MPPGKVVPPDKRKTYARKKKSVFCQNAQKKRLELGITQVELAKILGTTSARISEMEAGRLPRDEDRIIALADALDVTIDWLFRNKPEG